MLGSQPLDTYLADLASQRGTPGGGAAAAVTGAQAAALMSMVCNLTKNASAELVAAGDRAAAARARFIALADEDVAGFEAVMAAWRFPRAQREARLQPALRLACQAPLGMLREAAALIPPLQVIASEGNTNLVTDTAIAACLLESAMIAARLNVLINVNAMTDADIVASIQPELVSLMQESIHLASIRQNIEADLMRPASP